MSSVEFNEPSNSFDIAVIGMSCRFPGANNIKEFWENLCNGKESISFFTDEELLESGIDSTLIKDPNYVKARGIIDNAESFDAAFFNIFPKEAEIMDPQQRLFLECTWEALEDAGLSTDDYSGIVGVWGGVGMNTYLLPYLSQGPKSITTSEGYQLSIGNEKDFLTTRVSYKLNLKGPSLDLQTACSTSLVAIHNACLNLLNYQCDAAIAGGSTVYFPQKSGYLYQEGMILSPDGHCRPFDNEAKGTLGGNGCGIVILKRLLDAIADGDHIYAVIKGTACNNDGSDRIGYTAPGIEGQTQVIATALSAANVNPESIQYIETHGTGTILGDPIEISALTKVFREFTQKKNYCAVGSVKANIGHLDAAAGVAGFIKTVLSLYYSKITPSINFQTYNSKIDFQNSPFYVVIKLQEWKTNSHPRRAAVSSFGIGGTNAHVILEEAPVINKENMKKRTSQLLLWSAKTQTALANQKEKLSSFLKQTEDELGNIAFTLHTGRKKFNYRQAIVAESNEDALKKLSSSEGLKEIISGRLANDFENPKIAFMFTGQGAQYAGMGRNIYENEPVYKEIVDYCSEYLKPLINADLKKILFPDDNSMHIAVEQINQTNITQPALFVSEYALAKLLNSWGIKPDIMLGHSIGEYTAACLSEVISLDDALSLVSMRGKLMQKLPAGAMIAVSLSEEQTAKYLNGSKVSVAAINSHGFLTLSGTFEDIMQTEQMLKESSVEFRRLHTSHAFHSEMMSPILDEFESEVRSVKLNPPCIPYMSNLTGKLITSTEATDPAYYPCHLRSTVRFSENLREVIKDKNTILIEIGPGNTLCSFAKSQAGVQAASIIPTMRHPKEEKNDYSYLLSSLGKLWVNGIDVDWKEFHSRETPLKVSLPSYPFDRKKYWLNVAKQAKNKEQNAEKVRKDIEEWFYIPSWKRKNITAVPLEEKKRWLILAAKDETIDDFVKEELLKNEQAVTIAFSGKGYKRIDESLFVINQYSYEDYRKLFEELKLEDSVPDNIIVLWNVTGSECDELTVIEKQEDSYLGYFSLVNLARAIDETKIKRRINICSVTLNIFGVTSTDFTKSEDRTALGPIHVIPQEYPNIKCKLLDLENTNFNEHLIRAVLGEVISNETDKVVAYRGKYKWVQSYESIKFNEKPTRNSLLRTNGVYLITGGLGKIGIQLTELLAKEYSARIILTSITNFPSKKRWANWLQTHSENDPLSERIKQFKTLESTGAEITVFKADVADINEMKEVVDTIIENYGELNGVFHLAGIVGDNAFKMISELSADDFKEQIQPKIEGVKVLKEVLKRKKADFIVLQSSLSTILGGIGFTAYSAANCFMDAFAIKANKSSNTKWISIAWDGWRFNDDLSAIKASFNNNLILPEEGKKAFQIILSEFVSSRVIVSTEDINNRIFKQQLLNESQPNEPSNNATVEAIPGSHRTEESDRPDISTEYIAPSSELELQILKIWQDLLGIKSIGINDSFFDLGGNSLLGTQMITKLRQEFKCELPLKTLFQDPTISGISSMIESKKPEVNLNLSRVDELLKQVSKLSDEEVLKLLKQKDANG